MSNPESQAPAPQVQPIEDVVGDAMQSLLEFTFRFHKQRFGEAAALAAFDQVQIGAATLDARMQIRGSHTHLLCRLVPVNGEPPQILADWDLTTTMGESMH